MPTLDEAADELYAQPPGEFVAARSTWVARARSDGDKALAKEIGTLRRPTAAAHAVNLLARRPKSLAPLRDLGERLRAAQSRMDVDTMRSLSRERSQLVDRLTQEAAEATEGDGTASASTLEQLRETFIAALADPSAEQAVCSGRLVTALSYAGFGEVDVENAVATRLVLVHSSSEVDEDDAHTADLPEDFSDGDDTENEDQADDAETGREVAADADDPEDADEGDSTDDPDAEDGDDQDDREDQEDQDDAAEELAAAQERLDDAEESLSDADALMTEAETELTEARAELARARDRLSAAMEQRDAARDERARARQERRDARTAVRRASH